MLQVHTELSLFSSKESTLLCKLLCVKDGGFPDLEKQLTFYANSFDTVKAKAEGIIIPNQGVNQQYDSSQEQVNSILEELNQYLIQQKRRLNCKVSCDAGNTSFRVAWLWICLT